MTKQSSTYLSHSIGWMGTELMASTSNIHEQEGYRKIKGNPWLCHVSPHNTNVEEEISTWRWNSSSVMMWYMHVKVQWCNCVSHCKYVWLGRWQGPLRLMLKGPSHLRMYCTSLPLVWHFDLTHKVLSVHNVMGANSFCHPYVTAPLLETMGLSGVSCLWILGSIYNLGGLHLLGIVFHMWCSLVLSVLWYSILCWCVFVLVAWSATTGLHVALCTDSS